MTQLIHVGTYQSQVEMMGADLAGVATKRRLGDVDLDLIWEEPHRGPKDYWGNTLWDHPQTSPVSGPLPFAPEVYKLPYVLGYAVHNQANQSHHPLKLGLS